MIHNGHLIAQRLHILVGDAQAGQHHVPSYGHHLLQDALLAAQLFHLVEQLGIRNLLCWLVTCLIGSSNYYSSVAHAAYHILEYILNALLRILALLGSYQQINALQLATRPAKINNA